MRTARWVGVASVVALISAGLLTERWACAAVGSEEPLAFVTPSKLQLSTAQVQLTPAEANQLAGAWLSLLDENDPRLAGGALDLLSDAPQLMIESIATKLSGTDRLARVWAKASPETQNRIRNARAMNTAKLLDFAPEGFLLELETALAAGDPMSVGNVTSTAGGFRHLPAEVVSKIVAALEAGKLGDQQRRELVALLRNHPNDLSPVKSQLLGWLANRSPDLVVTQKHDLALTALLLLRVPLADDDIMLALKSSDLAVSRAAIGYLRTTSAGASPASNLSAVMADQVALLMHDAKKMDDWLNAYELLRERNLPFLEHQYRTTPAALVTKIWSADLAAEWLKRAPASVQSSLAADFPLDLYDPPAGQFVDCDALRYKFALLSVHSKVERPTLKDFWENAASKTHNCRDPLGKEMDAYLAEAGKGHDVTDNLVALVRQHGLGQLPEWQPRSTSLSQHLASELTRRLVAADWTVAKQLLLSGVRPSPTLLEQQGFWKNINLSHSGLGAEWFFRFLQAAGAAPEPILQSVAQAATDPSLDPVARATALIALAAVGRVVQRQDVFNAALNDGNQLVSRTALLLLGRAYDEGLPKTAFKGPDKELVETVLTRPELTSDVLNWLPRLVRFGPTYSRLQADQVKWSTEPSASCFSLVPARPLNVDVGIAILNAVPSDASADVLRACVALLSDANSPVTTIARQWDKPTIAKPVSMLVALKSLWQSPEFKEAGDPLKKKVAMLATTAGAALPYELGSQSTLAWWENTLRSDQQPVAASQLHSERRKRMIIGALIGLPAAVLLHLGFWAILLVGYPSSPTLQAVVFWNPFIRKVIGFGYIDLVLLYVPVARRRLFAPFTSDFLRDIRDTQELASHSYFEGSLIQHWPARLGDAPTVQAEVRAITSALATHRGRALLLGKSGLGKSSFLKFWLTKRAARGKDIIIYLRADQCRGGVEAEIVKRMRSVGSDQNLLRSVLYAGRMFVYIDGYNEVDLTTQDAITSFVGDYPHGNILITSQIPLRGFTGIETFELLPLDSLQIRDFLTTRSEILPIDAVVRDDAYRRAAGAFLDDVWDRQATEVEARAFEEILANPMDLTSVALLLSQGGIPDLFALEKQQFDTVKRRLTAQSLEFRTLGFSRSLLTQRLADQEDLGGLPFKPEVAELVHAKLAQVRTFSDPSGKSSAQEIRFRHDRIRDFFTHFVLLEMLPQEQAVHAKDARFAGVFPYLARSMPRENAEALREHLITLAADIEDHRVSDSFVREYSFRQRFASQDPEWMLSHDLPAAKDADKEYGDLAQKRENLQATMGRLREQIASSRRLTRVLTTADSAEMVSLTREMLLAMGASEAKVQQPIGAMLTDPHGQDFLLVALAQSKTIQPFHVDLLLARIEQSDVPKLVVLNSQVDVAPEARTSDLSPGQHEALLARGAVPMGSFELYNAFRAASLDRPYDVWALLAGRWPAREPSTIS